MQLRSTNLARFLDQTAQKQPEHVALVTDDSRITYSELLAAVNKIACELQQQGVKKGDRVAIALKNCPEFIIGYFAILKVGAVVVSLNPMNKLYEIAHSIETVDIKGYITDRKLAVDFRESLELVKQEPFLLVINEPSEEKGTWNYALKHHPETFETVLTSDDDPAVIIFTSAHEGGYARGAILTHGSIGYNATASNIEWELTPSDRHVGALPFYHSYGCVSVIICSVMFGSSVSIINRFVPQDLARRIREEKCTHFAAVPAMLMALWMLEDVKKEDFASLKFVIAGGAAIPLQALQNFEQKFDKKIQEGYGLTECSPVVSWNQKKGIIKNGTVGLPMLGIQVAIIDEEWNQLPPNTEGEVAVKGPILMKGYWNDPEFTKKVIKGDWLRTGDLGKLDEDGYLTLTGRTKYMVLTGGFNIYPEEVERLMAHVPLVENVEFSVEPDLFQGELLKAKVKLKPGVQATEKELRNACAKVMALYKVPRIFEIVGE